MKYLPRNLDSFVIGFALLVFLSGLVGLWVHDPVPGHLIPFWGGVGLLLLGGSVYFFWEAYDL